MGSQGILRADSERTMRVILEASERVLSRNPAATMEQIAAAAGVARTTVHRRFATRELLIEALTRWAFDQFLNAVAQARTETAPPLVALYQVTVNVLQLKNDWSFAMNTPASSGSVMAEAHQEMLHCCDRLFARARDAGVLKPDADLVWTRQVYYALIQAASQPIDGSECPERDPRGIDGRATLVVNTLLAGLGAGDVKQSSAFGSAESHGSVE